MKFSIVWFLVFLISVSLTHGQPGGLHQASWMRPDGPVYAMTRHGDTLIMGGSFTNFSYPVHGGISLNDSNALPVAGWENFYADGAVLTAIPDGQGGWYIGGTFREINGQKQGRLARIAADGTLYPWNPNMSGNVYSLSLCGNTLYVGGYFKKVGQIVRKYLAAFDITTGGLTTWSPDPGTFVKQLTASNGRVFIMREYSNLGCIDSATGSFTSWQIVTAGGPVNSIYAHGNTVYLAGKFHTVNGFTRTKVAAVDNITGAPLPWSPTISGTEVIDADILGNKILLAGYFNMVNGLPRNNFAAIDLTTGVVGSIDVAAVNGWIHGVTAHGNKIYLSGNFTSINGVSQKGFAALDANTGTLLGWDPKAKTLPISGHGCIASSASGIFIGQIPAVGVVARKGLAAINVTTGILTDWQPSIAYSGTVYALCRSSDTLFVGGRFGGFSQAHSGMVAVSVSDGALLNWNPGFSNYMDEVRTIIKSGNTIFAGGKFSSVGGYLRKGLVAIDAATLTVTTWNPIVSNGTGLPDITAMTEYAGKLYVAGNFDAINGIPRSRLASIDVATAQPATFSPSMTGNVNTLFASGNTLYVGGSYGSILGQPRTSLAAIDMTADTLLPWNPAISSNGFPKVLTLHTQGSSVYCGGEFSHMNGLPRNNLAVVNATGALQGTSADISGSVYAINSQGQTVFAGGSFLSLSNPRINNMTAFIDCPGEVQINYTGPGSFCGGSAASLLVAGGSIGAAGYDLQWNLNGSPIPGATDTSYLAIDGGSYTVSLSNGLACPVKISLPEFLTVKPTPDPSFASGGPLQFCEGGSVLMSAAHPGAGITFTWLKNGAYLGGGDTKTIKNTGSYNLVAKQNGCNDTSASFTVTAYPLPIASLSTTDSTTICSGDQVGLLASPDYPGFTYYWKNGSTFTDTTAIAGYNTGTAGTYKIMVMDTMGCVSKLSTSKVKVIVKQAPIASITAIGSTTLTSSTTVKLKAMPKTGATWQWTLDGTPITGATANQFIASASGDYAVEITVNGCTDTAAAVTVIQTGQRTPDEDMPFIAASGSEILTVYPNPANRALNISTTDSDQEGLLQMMDMGGRLIKSYRIKGYLTIDVASLTTGIYLLKYNSDNGNVSMTRFVKD